MAAGAGVHRQANERNGASHLGYVTGLPVRPRPDEGGDQVGEAVDIHSGAEPFLPQAAKLVDLGRLELCVPLGEFFCLAVMLEPDEPPITPTIAE